MVATLTIVENIYFQRPNEDAHHVRNTVSLQISSDEDPFQRTYDVETMPKPIEKGWVEEFSMVHIANKGPRSVYVDFGDERGSIPPGLSVRFPSGKSVPEIWADEPTRVTVTVYPQ